MILAERPDGIRLVRITRPEEVVAYRASFAGAYQDVFSEPPYNERISPSEAEGALSRYLQVPEHITLLSLQGRTKVVGFGIAVPLVGRQEIARELRGLIPVQHTFYLAELGVLESQRGKGLGTSLVEMRLALMDRRRYSHVVLRTSAVRNESYEMYMRLGFDDMGVYMEVPARRVDGSVKTDRRLFLSKVLTAEDAPAPSV